MRAQQSRPRIVIAAAGAAKLLITLYPRATRRRFGEDMAEVIDQAVDDVFGTGGSLGVLCALPALIADLLMGVVVEWADRCREPGSLTDRFVLACLGASAATWIIMGLAATLEWRWAGAVLEINLPATMLLAFGLPAAALGASRFRRVAGPAGNRGAALHRLSALATVGAWSMLAAHLLEHA